MFCVKNVDVDENVKLVPYGKSFKQISWTKTMDIIFVLFADNGDFALLMLRD